ncbi:MAG: hypothetical protein VKS61_02710 [Candidatus Sericytochromatia bacterium]|nr:hypothetical protein [Candidatus Sericytochromatia bacterium]
MKLSLILAALAFCLVVFGCHDAPTSPVKRQRSRKAPREPQAGDAPAPPGQVVTLDQHVRERPMSRRYR